MSLRGSIPVLRLGRTLLVSVQVELSDSVAQAMQEDVLRTIERTGATGLVIDITGLDLVDSHVARTLVDTARMAGLMGTSTVLVGMRPEVSSTLVRMGFPLEGVRTALNMDDGIALLEGRGPAPPRT